MRSNRAANSSRRTRCRCRIWTCRRCQEKSLEHLEVLIGLFISRQMPALFEEHDLCAGYRVRDAPGGERRNVHVETAGDDQGREAKIRKLWREIEVRRGLLHG